MNCGMSDHLPAIIWKRRKKYEKWKTKDAVVHGNAENHGKIVIFPSTYTGGARNLHEYAQDATTYLRYGGKPSFFIT